MIRRHMLGVFIGDVLHVGAFMYGVGEADDFEPLLTVFQYPAWSDAHKQRSFTAIRQEG